MKHVLIVENNNESLKINESSTNSSKFLLSGTFTEFDIENRNRRFYTAENFIPCMNAMLEKKKLLGVLYGEFDHPDVFDIAGKNISHAIEELTHNESANKIDGTIALLSTHYGKEARAIINDGYPLFVSSRAAGVTDSNGNVTLKEMFTYDIVVDPGFASSRVNVNESLGYGNKDVPYRIYEMNDTGVQDMHVDNKNDEKIKMDLKMMESILADEMAKLEYEIMNKIAEKRIAPEEMSELVEKYDAVNSELSAVKEYLEIFKKQINILVKENAKLVKENTKLVSEVNENTLYSNHLASSLKELNQYANDIDSRLSIDEKMIEYVAEHTKANILFTEELYKETEITQKFAEHIANETEVAQKFAEHIANETKINRQFAEYVANEAKITKDEVAVTQGFAEYVANEAYGDQVFLEYIANKVDGIIGYTNETVNKIKTSTPVNENISNEEGIHSIESIIEYLGITEEQEVLNNIEVTTEEVEVTTEEVEVTTEEVEVTTEEAEVTTEEAEVTTEEPTDEAEVTTEEPTMEEPTMEEPTMEEPATEEPATEEPATEEPTTEEPTMEITPEVETSIETTLLSSLVKILGTDDTGIVIEVKPDNTVIIQKSGSDETMPVDMDGIEVINTDENITNTVNDVLAEIKRQKTLSNQQPHFFNFLTEQQIIDFKMLEKSVQDSIVIAMSENEYMTTEDVLNIIGSTLNANTISYEEKIVSNIPENIKEAWNVLTQDQKVSIIAESKYFPLTTKSDIKNFWNTRPFAKAVNSPEAIMIKESLNFNETNEFNEDYVNAFLKSIDKLK